MRKYIVTPRKQINDLVEAFREMLEGKGDMGDLYLNKINSMHNRERVSTIHSKPEDTKIDDWFLIGL